MTISWRKNGMLGYCEFNTDICNKDTIQVYYYQAFYMNQNPI